MKYYIGLACTGHENALAIVDQDGEIVFAEATERFLQNKRAVNTPPDDPLRMPRLVKRYCEPCSSIVVAKTWSKDAPQKMRADAAQILKALAGADARTDRDWIARVAFHAGLSDKLIEPNYKLAGNGIERYCSLQGLPHSVRSYKHHLTHAAYACYTSPFDDAVCAVFDGYGEGVHSSYFHFRDGALEAIRGARSDKGRYGSLASLGLYYGYTICALLGLDIVNGEEWKVMGLAPYGQLNHEFLEVLRRHIHVDGLDLVMDDNAAATYRELQAFARRADQSYESVADIAYTAQRYFGEVMLQMLAGLRQLRLSDRLVLSGGCALNSTFNGCVAPRSGFERLYVPPAPSDDGNAVGAALLAFAEDGGRVPRPSFHTPYLGSSIEEKELEPYLKNGAMLGRISVHPNELSDYVAYALAAGKVVGWIQGRAEFGPRSLGNRSILADPRQASMKEKINAIVKFREGFRPFAPSILDEFGDSYFEDYSATPYMEKTLRIREALREEIPAVCHVDHTGRLQTVREEWNPRFYALLRSFHALTGTPVLLNTSLNVMGKPIVHSAADAFTVFLSTGLDLLVINDHVFAKR
jgi:carbamoyltransferase